MKFFLSRINYSDKVEHCAMTSTRDGKIVSLKIAVIYRDNLNSTANAAAARAI